MEPPRNRPNGELTHNGKDDAKDNWADEQAGGSPRDPRINHSLGRAIGDNMVSFTLTTPSLEIVTFVKGIPRRRTAARYPYGTLRTEQLYGEKRVMSEMTRKRCIGAFKITHNRDFAEKWSNVWEHTSGEEKRVVEAGI